jgi:uncharacterized membrane protein (UPF0127 family)
MTAPRRLARLPARPLPGGITVAEAATPRSRLLGLAGLDALPEGWALRIRPCASVHTLGMRFALDLVWLDGEDRVLRVDEGVPPRRHRACRGARQVIETRSGDGLRVAAAVDVGFGPGPGPPG